MPQAESQTITPDYRAMLDEIARRAQRALIPLGQIIEDLIARVDAQDGDPDLEPSLGNSYGYADDTELDTADNEPSLGSKEMGDHESQERWSAGNADDREDEHDGSEPSLGSSEPSLGSQAYPTGYDQRGWGAGPQDDREDEHDGREYDDPKNLHGDVL